MGSLWFLQVNASNKLILVGCHDSLGGCHDTLGLHFTFGSVLPLMQSSNPLMKIFSLWGPVGGIVLPREGYFHYDGWSTRGQAQDKRCPRKSKKRKRTFPFQHSVVSVFHSTFLFFPSICWILSNVRYWKYSVLRNLRVSRACMWSVSSASWWTVWRGGMSPSRYSATNWHESHLSDILPFSRLFEGLTPIFSTLEK